MSKIIEFFYTHPEANEVHEALGRLFTDKEKAQQFLAGVAGHTVITHTREGIQYAKPSDQLKHAVLLQENIVDAYQVKYEQAAGADKETVMNAWNQEKKTLADLQYKLSKQLKEEEKDAAIEKQPVVISPEPIVFVPDPVVEEPTAPVIEEPTAPVVEEPTALVVEEPTVEEPVVEEQPEQVVEKTPEPVVKKDNKQTGKGKK